MISFTILLFLLPSLAAAYSFKFTSIPTQCQELSLAIDGQGSPPYQILIIPVGPSTAPDNVEVRRVIDQTFPNNGTTVSFPLRFPANSQFVAVVRLFALISFSFPSCTPRPTGLRPVRFWHRRNECFCDRPVQFRFLMLRYFPKCPTPIRVQSLPGKGPHTVLTDPALVGQRHRSRVRPCSEAFRNHITPTSYLPYVSVLLRSKALSLAARASRSPRVI